MNKFWKDWLDEDYKIVRKRKEIQNITVLIVRFLTSELPDYLFIRTRSKNTHKFVGDKQYWEFILLYLPDKIRLPESKQVIPTSNQCQIIEYFDIVWFTDAIFWVLLAFSQRIICNFAFKRKHIKLRRI